MKTPEALAKALEVPVSKLIANDFNDNPCEIDLEKFLEKRGIKFLGTLLSEQDKEDIVSFLNMLKKA